eukprot:1142564-Pelagomonas_calceolata.AAC.5
MVNGRQVRSHLRRGVVEREERARGQGSTLEPKRTDLGGSSQRALRKDPTVSASTNSESHQLANQTNVDPAGCRPSFQACVSPSRKQPVQWPPPTPPSPIAWIA